MQSTFQLAMLIPTTAVVIFWVVLANRYEKKFEEITASINPEDYYLNELFYIGFQVMEIIHFNIKSDVSRKKIKLMSEVYGKNTRIFRRREDYICHYSASNYFPPGAFGQ